MFKEKYLAKKNFKNKNYKELLIILKEEFQNDKRAVAKFIFSSKGIEWHKEISFQYFIKSELFIDNIEYFFRNYYYLVNILRGYFLQNSVTCNELIIYASQKHHIIFIDIFKSSKVFEKPFHYDFIRKINEELKNIYLDKTIKEIDFLIKFKSDLEKSILSRYETFFKKISIIELIYIYWLNYENLRLKQNNAPVFSFDFTEYQETTAEIFSLIIKTYKRINQNILVDITREEIEKIYLNTLISYTKDKDFRKFGESITKDFHDLHLFEKTFNFYCYQNWEIDFSQFTKPILKPANEDRHKFWIKNGLKYESRHSWFQNFIQCNPLYESNFNVSKSEEDLKADFKLYTFTTEYQYSLLPEKIKIAEWTEFEFTDFIYFGTFFGLYSDLRYLKPIQQKTYSSKNEIFFEDILSIYFQGPGGPGNGVPINIRPIEEQISGFLKTDSNRNKDQIESIHKFLTTDLINDTEIDITKKPLMKIGNYYCYISSMFHDRNIAAILIDLVEKEILARPPRIKYNSKNWSDRYERRIAELFEEHKYSVIQGLEFEDNFNEKFETDILAFQNDTLFLIELKLSYERIANQFVSNYRYTQLAKAAYQLENAMEFFTSESGQKKIHDLMKIYPKRKIKVFPLIITNSFEDDYQKVNDKIYKISLFELERIFQNDLQFLVNLQMEIFEALGRDDLKAKNIDMVKSRIIDFGLINDLKNIKQSDWEKSVIEIRKKFSLRKEEFCSPDHLIDCIKNDKVWLHLNSYDYTFREGEIFLNENSSLRTFM